MKLTTKEKKIVSMIKKAYIAECGQEKWDSLTDAEKHDAIMILVRDALKYML